jgi:hypothetical protein
VACITAQVGAAHAAITHYATSDSATVGSAKALAGHVLLGGCAAQGLPLDTDALQANLGLVVWALGPSGALDPAPQPGSACAKTLRLTLRNIASRSQKHGGALLGSLV